MSLISLSHSRSLILALSLSSSQLYLLILLLLLAINITSIHTLLVSNPTNLTRAYNHLVVLNTITATADFKPCRR